MLTNSPLNTLTSLLHENGWVSRDANSFNSKCTIKTELVEPVLTCLGWVLDDLNQVIPSDNRIGVDVDYVLLDRDGEVFGVIQCVPNMDAEVERETLFAAIDFSERARIDAIVFTNGSDWKFFDIGTNDPHKPDHRIDLRHDRLPACAAVLVRYLDISLGWHECLSSCGQSQPAGWRAKSIYASVPDAGHNASHSAVNYTSTGGSSWLTLPEAAEIVTYSKPVRFRLPDGREIELKTWREVLVAACEFAIEQNPAISLPFRDASANGVNLMSYSQEYPFNRITLIEIAEKRIYIYIYYSARAALANIAYMLRSAAFPEKVSPAILLAARRTGNKRRQFREETTNNYQPSSVAEQLVPRTMTMEFD